MRMGIAASSAFHQRAAVKRFPLLLTIALSLAARGVAETVKDREGAVRKDRAAVENDARWIYNDWQRGFAEAKRTGKPLLIVLRCVPCVACMRIDAQVLLQESDVAPLLEQFVCVRLINANALDLSLFQFDYDLSFSTLFFNGDGTVYGRYGSWIHQKNPQEEATASYWRALEAALAIHREYPANRAALAGKQGGPVPFKTPLEIPMLAGKYPSSLDWEGKVVQSCVHCHQIGDAFRASYRDQHQPIPPELIFPMPAPETIGLTLMPDQAARVEAVAADSIAARAGFLPGDEIASFAGQPPISIADISWALHRGPGSGSLEAVVMRGGVKKALVLTLPAGWREKADISRRVGTWPMRAMAAGGLVLEDLANDERGRRGLDAAQMALFVKGLGQYGLHAAAKNAGFQKEDVIVEIDGVTTRMTEGELIGYLLAKHLPGERVTAAVQRGTQRIELSLPMQ